VIIATPDTNVIISAVLFQGPPRQVLQAAIAGRYRLALSQAILDETRSVLRRTKFGLEPAFVGGVMRELESLGELFYPRVHHTVVVRDPTDNMIVDCAVEAAADFIITGDNDLLSLGTAAGIPVVPPAEFIQNLPQL